MFTLPKNYQARRIRSFKYDRSSNIIIALDDWNKQKCNVLPILHHFEKYNRSNYCQFMKKSDNRFIQVEAWSLSMPHFNEDSDSLNLRELSSLMICQFIETY